MSEVPEPNGSTSIKTKWFEVSGKKTAELITIFSLLITAVLAYGFWEHKADARTGTSEVVLAIKEMTRAQVDNVREQRVLNCLISLEQKDRPSRLAECERIAR